MPWPKLLGRIQHRSTISELISLQKESNLLLRELIQLLSGRSAATPRPRPPDLRKRTASDVFQVTHPMRVAQALKDQDLHDHPWRENNGVPLNAADHRLDPRIEEMNRITLQVLNKPSAADPADPAAAGTASPTNDHAIERGRDGDR